mmetsp:Transcript_43012/g.98860  ORF Transcript_43012/g.98860 Transcript_43012/m.98860 type:complete len:250 (-) Transcript_43012:192-941(-)
MPSSSVSMIFQRDVALPTKSIFLQPLSNSTLDTVRLPSSSKIFLQPLMKLPPAAFPSLKRKSSIASDFCFCFLLRRRRMRFTVSFSISISMTKDGSRAAFFFRAFVSKHAISRTVIDCSPSKSSISEKIFPAGPWKPWVSHAMTKCSFGSVELGKSSVSTENIARAPPNVSVTQSLHWSSRAWSSGTISRSPIATSPAMERERATNAFHKPVVSPSHPARANASTNSEKSRSPASSGSSTRLHALCTLP